MRDLKFRAWDKKQKKMLYGVSIGTIRIWDERASLLSHEFSYSEDCIFEQYTGLKDKNGKEIYEGDIVKFADLELAMEPTGVVCFADGKFFIKDWDFGDGSYHIVDFYDYNIPYKDFEVIGSIHENPELCYNKENERQ